MNTFVIADPNKCIGCRTCQIACVVAHSDEDIFNPECKNISFNPRLSVVKTAIVSAPIQCRHCEDAPCANVCPNNSIVNKDGSIQINEETCIGCKTCLMACPLGAIELVDYYKEGEKVLQPNLIDMDSKNLCFKERIIANKCDLCINRDKGPACVEVCPTDAFKIVKEEDIKQSVKNKRSKSASLL
ncbi:MAG: 4Fe-4S dicluster domain-containing protein [Tepidibacter sp.]|jgi:electron transport protein HydN|uniref:4Fe-4S dicluster domain-containing protein n=1 Tax=Tepidibacter sp. TaxID=2529387 RepID=UPI0025D55B38|nr:4Fe-4S dicluster domain-containing protein [Tepidibacter sp.]MCT4507328.1 4Fe-4S dicluster domain-containing protein [Tepidibacter sp.]